MTELKWTGPYVFTDADRRFEANPDTVHDFEDEDRIEEYLSHPLFGDGWEEVDDAETSDETGGEADNAEISDTEAETETRDETGNGNENEDESERESEPDAPIDPDEYTVRELREHLTSEDAGYDVAELRAIDTAEAAGRDRSSAREAIADAIDQRDSE